MQRCCCFLFCAILALRALARTNLSHFAFVYSFCPDQLSRVAAVRGQKTDTRRLIDATAAAAVARALHHLCFRFKQPTHVHSLIISFRLSNIIQFVLFACLYRNSIRRNQTITEQSSSWFDRLLLSNCNFANSSIHQNPRPACLFVYSISNCYFCWKTPAIEFIANGRMGDETALWNAYAKRKAIECFENVGKGMVLDEKTIGFCKWVFDGILCWRNTEAGNLAVQSCPNDDFVYSSVKVS